MTAPSYPIAIAIKGSGGRKVKQDRNVRSARQRRKAYEKHERALIVAEWKKWGSVEAMPIQEQTNLDRRLNLLHSAFLGRRSE
jgi:hypothetical protein